LAFQVDITDPALADAEDYVRFVREVKKEPEAADRWFRGLVEAIYSLEDLPERCPVIPEREEFSYEIRHLVYFSHRIIFRVERERNRVVIYRVYHGSRQGLAEDDLPSLQL
jgi:plasmid stabilization system protein ParE